MELGRLLDELRPTEDENVLVGPETMDDAGVYRISADTALVQTADFITPVCDDALRFGRIAAANSISDVYAMGGRPITALNLCAFPACNIDTRLLLDICKGGIAKAEEAGARVIGGHSVEDEDLKYGLSVTGVVHPDRVTPNSGASVGDVLILTKPLGTGIMITAARFNYITDAEFTVVLDNMEALNGPASEVAAEFNVRGVTDITGFGIAGHGMEVALASKVRLRMALDRLPKYERAVEMNKRGASTRVTPTNAELVSKVTTYDPSFSLHERNLLHDPQTSGGLLLSVPGGASAAEECLAALKARGLEDAAIVGEVVNGEPGVEFVRA